MFNRNRMHSSRMRTIRCSGRLSCPAHPLLWCMPPAMTCPSYHASPPATHIPCHACPPPTTHKISLATHAPPAMHPPPPVDRRNDTRLWKHYFSVTTVADGNHKNVNFISPYLWWSDWLMPVSPELLILHHLWLTWRIVYVFPFSLLGILSWYILSFSLLGFLSWYMLSFLLLGILSWYMLSFLLLGILSCYMLSFSLLGILSCYMLSFSLLGFLSWYMLSFLLLVFLSLYMNVLRYILSASYTLSLLSSYSLSWSRLLFSPSTPFPFSVLFSTWASLWVCIPPCCHLSWCNVFGRHSCMSPVCYGRSCVPDRDPSHRALVSDIHWHLEQMRQLRLS